MQVVEIVACERQEFAALVINLAFIPGNHLFIKRLSVVKTSCGIDRSGLGVYLFLPANAA